jgi:ABC-type bacteriocin/lantibiotic exporter with double-glycine peptidase domain
VALIGASGCGKSTIFRLLLGFYAPQEGQILLEGIDIRDFDIYHLRRSFGVVSQEPKLFNKTIEWNIRYNKEEATRKDIVEAAHKANFLV